MGAPAGRAARIGFSAAGVFPAPFCGGWAFYGPTRAASPIAGAVHRASCELDELEEQSANAPTPTRVKWAAVR